MFERDHQQDDYSQSGGYSSQNETILSSDTKFKGSLEFNDKLTINGNFDGNLKSKGTLLVGSTGEVKAEIKVGSIIIEGKIWGNINASDKIEIRSGAELYGDIRGKRLIINEGAIFVGKSDVDPNRDEKPASSSSSNTQQRQDQKQDQKQDQSKSKNNDDKKNNVSAEDNKKEQKKESLFSSMK